VTPRPLVLAALLSSSCGPGPTSPPEIPLPAPPRFVFYGATPEEQAFVGATWEQLAGCVGLDPNKARAIPVTITEEQFFCSGVDAAGCAYSTPPSVTIRRSWWGIETSIRTELLHLALLLNREDWGYDNPAFARCL